MKSYSYKYPRPSVTVDAIILDTTGTGHRVLLIQRGGAPFEGDWAFPGGFLEMDETAEDGVLRELSEETGITGVAFEQLCTTSTVDRDPRGRVISIAYLGFANVSDLEFAAADDAADVRWFGIDALPAMAFDHREILERALRHIAQD